MHIPLIQIITRRIIIVIITIVIATTKVVIIMDDLAISLGSVDKEIIQEVRIIMGIIDIIRLIGLTQGLLVIIVIKRNIF